MGAKGLTKERIVAQAVAMIEESGQSSISLHELARRLDIKPPSLYNHIKNTTDLRHEVFRYAIDQLVAHQKEATAGKGKDEAVRAFAEAYHGFAMENRGLYRLIMSMPQNQDEAEKEMAVPLLEMVVELLDDYGLDEEGKAHWQRVLRAILHGFISQEDLGYFYYYQDMDLKKSRDIAIECYLHGLHEALEEKEKDHAET